MAAETEQERQARLAQEAQKKAEREARAVARRTASSTPGVDRGGQRITQDGSGQGLTVQSEWDKLFKNTASNDFGKEGKVNEAYVGMPKPKLASMLSDVKPESASQNLAATSDATDPTASTPVFSQVNDEGLNITLGLEDFNRPMLNSAQRFDLEGSNIFKGIKTPRKPFGLQASRTQSSFGNLSPYYSF